MPQFIIMPSASVDSAGKITTLTGAQISQGNIVAIAAGTYRVFATAEISTLFTPTGSSVTAGPVVIAGSEATQFLIVPALNINASNNLTSLTNSFVTTNLTVTGLLSNVAYRAIALTAPSDPVNTARVPDAFGTADWSVTDAVAGGILNFTFSTMPYNGGSALTNIYLYQDGSGTPIATGLTAPGTYSISGLTNGNQYSYTAAAVNALGVGALSAAKTATPTPPVAPGAVTFDTEEAAMIAEFASHPDKGWAGFGNLNGFTTVTCATPAEVVTAWNAWATGTPNTSKVRIIWDWDGLLTSGTATLNGPNSSKLVSDPNAPLGVYQFGPGGIMFEAASGKRPVWGSRLTIVGATRLHMKSVNFAGKADAPNPSANIASLTFDRNTTTLPGRLILYTEDCNFGQMDNRPGYTFADFCTSRLVKTGAYSVYDKRLRVAGNRLSLLNKSAYWKTEYLDFQQTCGDIRQTFGITDPAMAGRQVHIYHKWTLVRDMHQNASAAGLHTDWQQMGASSDTHGGYKAVHRYFLSHMKSSAANDSGSQGFYNDDATGSTRFDVAVADGVLAFGAFHLMTKYDPSKAGHFRIRRAAFYRSGEAGLNGSGVRQDTYPQFTISFGNTNGGSMELDNITFTKLGPFTRPAEPIMTNCRFCDPRIGVPAGQNGLVETAGKRLQEVIIGAGTFGTNAEGQMTYTIPNESIPTFAGGWYALRDFYTPIAGWGSAGQPTDPATWPGAPARP